MVTQDQTPAVAALFGRGRELTELIGLVRDPRTRLLTLLGPGGVGKTRLAQQCAREIEAECLDGTWFIPLADVSSVSLVLPAVAGGLGLQDFAGAGLLDRLIEFLRHRNALLVLDNVEHLLGIAPSLAAIVDACAGITILSTSRERLGAHGERIFPVPTLDVLRDEHLPKFVQIAGSGAVQLFVARSRSAAPNFMLASDNADAVLEIVRRLDGLPLAIELAAVHTRHLPPDALLARLERRLSMLERGDEAGPDRFQTMRAAIAWSFEHLLPAEQALFRRLAVFTGGCTSETAAAVVGDMGDDQAAKSDSLDDALAVLADRSLLVRTVQADGTHRFTLLETIREYAAERLLDHKESVHFQSRHARHFAERAIGVEPGLLGADFRRAIEWFSTEQANLRSALSWAIARRDAELTGSLAGAQMWFWYLAGLWSEAAGWFAPVVALTSELGRTRVRARVLFGGGAMAMLTGDVAAGLPDLRRAEDIFREVEDREGLGYALCTSGLALLGLNRGEEAMTALNEAVALFRDSPDRWGLALSLNSLGDGYLHGGDLDSATVAYRESLTRCEEIANLWGVAYSLKSLATVALLRQQFDGARELAQRSLDLARAIGFKRFVALSLHRVATADLHLGHEDTARTGFSEGVEFGAEIGDMRTVAECLEGLADVALQAGSTRHAARLFGAAAAVRDLHSAPPYPSEETALERHWAATRERLGASPFAAEWENGAGLAFSDVVEFALEELRAEAAARPNHAETSISRLSRRERDVLAHLADGRTDREIATALFISRPTASNHVASILAKLGVSNRAGAAALAGRDRLV